jgi:hypothetical protein
MIAWIDPELMWAAGFWDGEGHAGTRTTKKRPGRLKEFCYIRLQIAQVDREPLDRFTSIVDGGKVRGPYIPKTQGHSPYHLWTADHGARRIAKLLIPLVCRQKREQLESCLAKDEHVNEEV